MDYARDLGYGEVNPILISGIDSVRDFAMFVYATGENQVSMTLTADIPPITSTWANVWAGWSTNGTVHYNWGPTEDDLQRTTVTETSEAVALTSRSLNTHVSFIRGWRMKRRVKLFPTVIKAGAEPVI